MKKTYTVAIIIATVLLTGLGVDGKWGAQNVLAAVTQFIQGGNSFGTTAILGTNDNFGLSLETNNIERMRISTAGNVGVGTVSPEAKLNIVGGELWLFNEGQNPRIVLGDNGTTGQYGFAQWDSLNDYYRIETDGTNGLKVKGNNVSIGNIFPSEPLIVSAGVTELLRVNSAGNVGIGTGNPGTKLEVAGQVKITGGTPGTGRVLTSDTSGLATWEMPTNGLPFGTFGQTLRHDGMNWVANGVIYNNGTNVGIGSSAPEFRLTLDKGVTTPDGGILAIGTHLLGTTLATSGAGTRLIWYPQKSAFRVGYVSAFQWDDANIGNYSTAMGNNTIASGVNSTAIGHGTTASGFYSTALGYLTTASGFYSTALGNGTTANGVNSTALGNGTTASGDRSIAMGSDVIVSGINSTAIGTGVRINGNFSTAIGLHITADAESTIILGRGTPSNQLINNIASSLMIGFNSNIPTLFVGPSSGIGTTGNVGIGTASPNAKLQVTGGDAAISTQGNGLILKATDGPNCYRVTINNLGALSTTLVACP